MLYKLSSLSKTHKKLKGMLFNWTKQDKLQILSDLFNLLRVLDLFFRTPTVNSVLLFFVITIFCWYTKEVELGLAVAQPTKDMKSGRLESAARTVESNITESTLLVCGFRHQPLSMQLTPTATSLRAPC